MHEKFKVISVSLLIGISVAISYLAVEFIDTTGINFLWNNFFNTDENRLFVIPVAIFLSIIYSFVIKSFKQKRIGKSETNLLSDEEIKPTSVFDIFTIFIIGCTGLLAGASLGPEGVLVAISAGIGIWFAQKAKKMEAAKLMVLSAVGALLVGFFGSLLPILIPILVLYKKEKKIVIEHLIPPIIAGIATYLTLYIIKNGDIGFGSIPTGSTYNFQDIIGAFVIGIIASFFAYFIKILINKLQLITKNIANKTHWIIAATLFGGVIGILYFIGGPTIQFSGKEGTEMLLQNNTYTFGILVLFLITKFLATSWSLPAGYRGGLVFPSIYMAVVLSLIFTQLDPVLGGPGITIGATAGMMTAMLPPFLGFILVLSMIPFNFILVAIAGLIGAIIGTKLTSRLITLKSN